MRLMTNDGMGVDRPLSELDKLITLARATPYREMSEATKLRFSLLLHIQHQERERIRFAPIQYGFP